MQQSESILRRVAVFLMTLGFGVQIATGLIWMALRFAAVPGLRTVVHMALALYAFHRLMKTLQIRERKYHVFGILVLFTFPMTMQTYFTKTVISVFASLILILLSALMEMRRQTLKKSIVWICVMSLLLCGTGIYACKYENNGTRFSRPAAILASRFAWTSLEHVRNKWPEELTEKVPYTVIRDTVIYADNVDRVMVPALLERFGTDPAGRKQTDAVLFQVAKIGLLENTKGNLSEITWDLAGNLISPPVFLLQMEGMGYKSRAAYNYDAMLQEYPGLSAFFMRYGCRWFCVAFLLRICLISDRKRNRTGERKTWLVLPVILFALGATFRGAGMMDYRTTVFVVTLWLLWMLGGPAIYLVNENTAEAEQ